MYKRQDQSHLSLDTKDIPKVFKNVDLKKEN